MSFPEQMSRCHENKNFQSRIVALIDMDCFYVQVEQRLAPEWLGKPCAVVQYNEWKGGGIIAVGYEARAMGVTRRGMRGEDAREVCPDIKLFKVPEVRGKADLTRYREAGAEVIAVLLQFGKCKVERASVDEAYVDMTEEIEDMMSQSHVVTVENLPNTFIVGTDDAERETSVRDWLEQTNNEECLDVYNNRRLALGALLMERMRKAVKEQTGFNCSAGVSHNKVLSKLACGLHKPQKQTILSMSSVADLFASLPIPKVRHLGGKLGQQLMEDYSIQFIGDICRIEKQELISQYGDKTGNFLYDLCRGHDPEPVCSRQLVKSVGCSKNFRGRLVITGYKKAQHWLRQLSLEMEERLIKDREQNRRFSKSLALYVRFTDWHSVSRAIPLTRYSQQVIESSAMAALTKLCGESTTKFDPGINCLGLSAGKFEDIEGQNLTQFFQKAHNGSLIDPFDSLTTSNKSLDPLTPTKPHCSIKSFTSARVSPFDDFPTSPQRKENKIESPRKFIGCDLKPFVAGQQPIDPFESLEKAHPRINDNPLRSFDWEPPSVQVEKGFDMKSFLLNSKSVDPFDSFEKATHNTSRLASPLKQVANTKPDSTRSIKTFTVASGTVDPFASKSPRKGEPKLGGIQKYLKAPKNPCYKRPAQSGADLAAVIDISDVEIAKPVLEAMPTEASSFTSSNQRPASSASSVDDASSSSNSLCKALEENELLDEIIGIWNEESNDATFARSECEDSLVMDELSEENESELSVFEAVEEEERMFHRLTSTGSLEVSHSLASLKQGKSASNEPPEILSQAHRSLKSKLNNKHYGPLQSEVFGQSMSVNKELTAGSQEDKELQQLLPDGNSSLSTEACVGHISTEHQGDSLSRDGDEDVCVIWEADKSIKKHNNDHLKSSARPHTLPSSKRSQKSASLQSSMQFTIQDFFS
ncbi:uncharacterized protein [Watersipora subatra]|uniref:uncharacterized protein n=1 Tax=Watersipora subatra TaxID=2589382 RepID=UPI00355B0847